jgi:hypothetical protein
MALMFGQRDVPDGEIPDAPGEGERLEDGRFGGHDI